MSFEDSNKGLTHNYMERVRAHALEQQDLFLPESYAGGLAIDGALGTETERD